MIENDRRIIIPKRIMITIWWNFIILKGIII